MKLRLLGMAMGLLLWTSEGHATVFWEEGFDAETSNWVALGNSAPLRLNSGVLQIRTDVPRHSGTGSLVVVFDGRSIPVGTCLPGHPLNVVQCGGFWDRPHPATSTMWWRLWIYVPSTMTVASPTTKIIKGAAGTTQYSDWTGFHDGAANLQHALQDIPIIGDTTILNYGQTLARDTWHCLEARTTLNQPGVNDGIQENYINGSLQVSRSNVNFRKAGDVGLMTYVRLGRQDGSGEMYIDDLGTGDTRLGCTPGVPSGGGGTPPPPAPDANPPNAPTNLAVQ